ncbi:MAG: family 10 glycosylhydrolase [Sumerlaeia bacterium]
MLFASLLSADVVLDDFGSGVTAANHPEGAGVAGVWYDASSSTFGTPSASTLDGSPAMRIDDGGFTNGVYAIYDGVVPADGEYQIEIAMDVNEPGSATGFSAYQIGIAVGADAVHRGLNPSAVAPLALIGNYTGLTAGDDTANPTETVVTGTFAAQAGDSILIALGTDVQTGGWNANSSSWAGNFVLVDNIVLKDVTPPPPPPTGEVVVDNFDGGVVAQNNPTGGGAFGIWYDTTPSTFGTPSASTLDGSSAMRITDGGFANGVYAIYEGVVPATGSYEVEILMDIDESAGSPDGIRAFSVGVASGADAAHRAESGNLPSMAITGTYIGLTPSDDTANPTQAVSTGIFTANAGDNLLIALSTDVESGTWGGNSGLWSGSFATVDSIVLRGVEVEPPPFELVLDNDDGPAVYQTTGSWTTSGSPGYNGGTDQFAATQAPSTATWLGSIPETGFYEIAVQYRAGANRASVTTYEISTLEGTVVSSTDQRINNLTWVVLGEYELAEGAFNITLNAETCEPAGAVVLADAVRIRELPGPPPIDDPEMRIAIFLAFDPGMDDVGTIQAYVNDAVRKRYNAIAVHARYRGDATYFPNKTDATFPNNEPRSELVGDVDVIEEFVTRGHAAGLKVFAYVNTNLVTDGADTDPRPNHIVNLHPEWATYEWNYGNPIPQNTAEDPDGIWLDPGLPEVRAYTANILGDIVMNYDVDGIFIDRQRYPDTRFNREEGDFGYHPYNIAQFNSIYGKSGVPSPFDEDWHQYRRDQNTAAMQLYYSTITSLDPDALLLAYPIGRFNDAVNFNYQDWPAWLNNRVVDAVLPQIYTSSTSEFSARAAEHRAAYNGERLLGLAIDTFRPGVDIITQIDIARQLGFDGQSPFTHVSAGQLDYFQDLAVAWNGIAAFPETPWKAEAVDCDGIDMIGDDQDNLLVGTACDELIVGGIGNDTIIASGGDDVIVPDSSQEEEGDNPRRNERDDFIDGGDGEDTVDYSNVRAPIRVDLSEGYARKARGNDGIGSDTLVLIENIIGREGGDDVYIGDDGPNKIWSNGLYPTNPSLAGEHIDGRGGDDYIHTGGPGVGSNATHIRGGEGDDEIHGNDGRSNKQWGGPGNDTIYAYGGMDHVWGEDGDDYLDGGDGTDFLFGGPGNDTLMGGPGKDKVLEGGPGDDIIDGGPTNEDDRAQFSGTSADYTVCEYADGTVIVTDLRGIDGTDTLTNINRLSFSDRMITRSDWAQKIPGYSLCD